MFLHTAQKTEPIIPVEQEYHAPEFHLIKEEHLEENVEEAPPRLAPKRTIVKLQTERRLVRISVSELQHHISSNLHSSDGDPIGQGKIAKAKIAKAKIAKAKIAKAMKTKAKMDKFKIAMAEVANAKIAKADMAKAKIAKAEMAKAEMAKAKMAKAAKAKKAKIPDPNSTTGFLVTEQACKIQHLGQTCYSCPFCNQVFPLFSDIKPHVMLHSTQEIRDWKNAANTHNTRTVHSCKFCNEVFKTLRELKKHTDNHLAGVATQIIQLPPIPANTCISSAVGVLNNEDAHDVIEHTRKANQLNVGEKLYYSCLSCPQLFPTFPEAEKHSLIHDTSGKNLKLNSFGVVKISSQGHINEQTPDRSDNRNPAMEQSIHMKHTVEHSANANKSVVQTEETINECEVKNKQCTTIDELFTKEACLFRYLDRDFYSCIACPKIYATFPEVKKHGLKHFVIDKKAAFKPTPNVPISTTKHSTNVNTSTLERSTKVDKNVVQAPETVAKPSVTIADFTEEACLFKTRQKTFYSCLACPTLFSTFPEVKKHALLHFVDIKSYNCPVCNESFDNNKMLKVHKLKHTSKEHLNLMVCEKGLEHKPTQNSNSVKKSEYTHQCKTCGKGFTSERQLKGHSMSHAKRNFKCPDCDKIFYKRSSLLSHKQFHNLNKPRTCTCEICGETFTNQANLRSHISRQHTDKHSYKCEICSKIVSTPASLAAHRHMHTGEKSFTCVVCNKTFKAQNTLIVHLRLHTGEKPYKCNQCGKAFFKRSSLTVHKRCHTGLKPYACEECPKSFVTMTLLTNHEKKAHQYSA